MPAIVPTAKRTTRKTAMPKPRMKRIAGLRRLRFRVDDRTEHSVYKTSRILGREPLRQRNRFVDRDRRRRLRTAAYLKGCHFEQQAIDGRQALERPSLQERADDAIGLLRVLERSQRELLDERALLAVGLFPDHLAQRVLRLAGADDDAIERLERLFPGYAARRHRRASSLGRNSTS